MQMFKKFGEVYLLTEDTMLENFENGWKGLTLGQHMNETVGNK